jgi:hypothetical protein
MGLLSSISKTVKKVVSTAKTTTIKALDTGLALFAAPITTLTKGKTAGLKEVKTMGAVERTAKILGTTAVAAGAVLAGGTVAGRAVATKLIPTTTKGKVIAAVAAPIAIGAISKSPREVSEVIIKAPVELAEFGQGIAGVVTEPSVQSVKELVTDSPLLTATTAIAAGLVVGKVAAPVVGGLITKSAIEDIKLESPAAVTPIVSPTTPPVAAIPASAPVKQEGLTPMAAPITPELVNVKATTTKRKKRQAKKQVKSSISQRVNVIVSSRSSGTTTKNYLSRGVLQYA